MIKKTVIIAGYRCNNKCRFCIDAHKRDLPEKTTQEIITEMILTRRTGTTYLELIGGELTIRPDIIYLLSFAKKLRFEIIAMATNGRMLSYKDFCKKIVETGIDHIIFSIHGHNARLHDSLTQVKGSFDQLITGLNNLKELHFTNIGSNTTIVKQNYKYLFEVGKFIYRLGIRNSEFIFVDPSYGGANEHFKELVPKIEQASKYIRKCLDIGKRKNVFHWAIRYVPLCYFINYKDQVSELNEKKTFHTEHLAPDFKNFDVETSRSRIGRIRPIKCNHCREYDMCEGIWVEYYKRYGDRELKPIEDV